MIEKDRKFLKIGFTVGAVAIVLGSAAFMRLNSKSKEEPPKQSQFIKPIPLSPQKEPSDFNGDGINDKVIISKLEDKKIKITIEVSKEKQFDTALEYIIEFPKDEIVPGKVEVHGLYINEDNEADLIIKTNTNNSLKPFCNEEKIDGYLGRKEGPLEHLFTYTAANCVYEPLPSEKPENPLFGPGIPSQEI